MASGDRLNQITATPPPNLLPAAFLATRYNNTAVATCSPHIRTRPELTDIPKVNTPPLIFCHSAISNHPAGAWSYQYVYGDNRLKLPAAQACATYTPSSFS